MGSAAERTIIPYGQFELLREARAVMEEEAAGLAKVAAGLDEDFCKAVDLVCQCRGSVVVTGMGKAGLIGRKVAATLSSTGTRAHFLHPAEAAHGDLGCLSGDDVLVVLSNSGETEEVCRILPSIRRFGIPIVAITADRTSTLGSAAAATIELGHLREAGLHALAPSTSTTAMLAVGDALALVVGRRSGFYAPAVCRSSMRAEAWELRFKNRRTNHAKGRRAADCRRHEIDPRGLHRPVPSRTPDRRRDAGRWRGPALGPVYRQRPGQAAGTPMRRKARPADRRVDGLPAR